MPRVSRGSYSSCFFHNMVQGINKEYIFNQNKEKNKYIKLLKQSLEYDIEIISYVIMDNHAHLLLYVTDVTKMSEFMKNTNEKYAMYYNYINNRVGVVFRNRFKTQAIVSETHLYNCIKYIYDNPVKAKIVEKPEEYKYSNFTQFNNNALDKKILNCGQFSNMEKMYENESKILDTKEDELNYAKSIIDEYIKDKSLKNEDNQRKILQMLREKTNLSYNIISTLLKIPKTTLWKVDKKKK